MHRNYKQRIQSILKNVIDEEFTMIKFKSRIYSCKAGVEAWSLGERGERH